MLAKHQSITPTRDLPLEITPLR